MSGSGGDILKMQSVWAMEQPTRSQCFIRASNLGLHLVELSSLIGRELKSTSLASLGAKSFHEVTQNSKKREA